VIHTLEPRLFLDATIDGAGLLTINGSTGDDTINVSLDGANLNVSIAPEGFAQTFPSASVTGILVLAGDGTAYWVTLSAQLGLLLAAALAGTVRARALLVARYYVLTTASVAAGLWDWLRHGTPAGWEPAEGTR